MICSLRRSATAMAAVLALAFVAVAHEGDHRYMQALRDAYTGPRLAVGIDGADEALRAIVALTGRLHTESAPWLLPPGTRLDRSEWVSNVMEIDLTVPKVANVWYLTDADLETLTAALATPFAQSPAFGGTRVRVRVGAEGKYGTLASLMEASTPPAPIATPDPQIAPADAVDVRDDDPADRIGSPTIGTRQPAGALSGVTVYVSAGHGWTAGGSAWVLQRPVLLGMCEDYGNIDVMNYFAHFARNAGATVVPFRPVGWQPIEIVLDQDDPGVTFTGSWNDGASSKYFENGVTNSGVVYKSTTATATETATARYAPIISVTDFYPVYAFTIGGLNRAQAQLYRIKHSGGIAEVRVDHRNVGNGWVWLGDYHLVAGEEAYVEISNSAGNFSGGAIIADAIRWGGGVGTVSRPGPNSISGYPSDEEGQRYWAHSQLGQNAVGFSSSIWDGGGDDLSDNVGAAARWAAEMNVEPAGGVQSERWKRVHLEFHSNAFNGAARGQVCLITNTGSTTNQTNFATILSDEFDADMNELQTEFEHSWFDRSAATLTGAYGAISTGNNGNEFDATLVELAFHDNTQDAQLLRDSRVRQAMARACVQGIVRFLTTLPGSQVPLFFAPDTPKSVAALDQGDGTFLLKWRAPDSSGALGDPATGYVVYQSSNGLGFSLRQQFASPTFSLAVGDIAVGETRYFRIAATNAGGESMPSEVLAVRRPATPGPKVLVVNGYDRLRRDQNPVQTFTQPPAYAGQSIERQIWRSSNSYDYIIEYAAALAASDYAVASCSNDAVISNDVTLGDYDVVIWALGNERTEDRTLDGSEQSRLQTYLNNGGKLFISGSDIAYDLIAQGGGGFFGASVLRMNYAADDAGTYTVLPASGGAFDGLSAFSFSPAAGARYDAYRPDSLGPREGSVSALVYSGGAVAAVQYAGAYAVIAAGFPFETIASPADRAAVMQRAMTFMLGAEPLPFDFDDDGDVDVDDFGAQEFCYQGPDVVYPPGQFCLEFSADADGDVDLVDFAAFQAVFTGPNP